MHQLSSKQNVNFSGIWQNSQCSHLISVVQKRKGMYIGLVFFGNASKNKDLGFGHWKQLPV